jgi:hypothetical protein
MALHRQRQATFTTVGTGVINYADSDSNSKAKIEKIAAKATARQEMPETRAVLVAAWEKRRQKHLNGFIISPQGLANISAPQKGRKGTKRSPETGVRISQA